MKCPICGKEEFIESPWFPIDVQGDATLLLKEIKSFVCINCGYLVFVNTGIKEILFANKTKIEIMSKKISEKEEKVERLKKELQENYDTSSLYRIKSLNNEIKAMKSEIKTIKTMFKPALQNIKPVKRLSEFEENEIFNPKKIWQTLIRVYQDNDPNNSNTLSISDSVAKSMHHVMTIYELAKEKGYRPYPFNGSNTLIVIDEKEKQELKKPYVNTYTFDEFIKDKK